MVKPCNKRWKLSNPHSFAEKLMDKCYETLKNKLDLELSTVNWLNFVTYGSDDQVKCLITNLSVHMSF